MPVTYQHRNGNELLARLRLMASASGDDSGTYIPDGDSVLKLQEVKYFAQDSSGEWYGYQARPFYDAEKRVWKVDFIGYLYLGTTEREHDYNWTIYEVTT